MNVLNYEKALEEAAAEKSVEIDFGYFGNHNYKLEYVDKKGIKVDISHKMALKKNLDNENIYNYFGNQIISGIPNNAIEFILTLWESDEAKAKTVTVYFKTNGEEKITIEHNKLPIIESYLQIPQFIQISKETVTTAETINNLFKMYDTCLNKLSCRTTQYFDEKYILINSRIVGIAQPIIYATFGNHPFFQDTPLPIVYRPAPGFGTNTLSNAAFYIGLLQSDEEFIPKFKTQKAKSIEADTVLCNAYKCNLDDVLAKSFMSISYAVPASNSKEGLHVPAHYVFIEPTGSINHGMDRNGNYLMLIDPSFDNSSNTTKLKGAKDGKFYYHTVDVTSWNAHTGVTILMPKADFSARVTPFFNDMPYNSKYDIYDYMPFTDFGKDPVRSHYISSRPDVDRFNVDGEKYAAGSYFYLQRNIKISTEDLLKKNLNMDITNTVISVVRIKLEEDPDDNQLASFPYVLDFNNDKFSIVGTFDWTARSFLYYGAFSEEDLIHIAGKDTHEHVYMLPAIKKANNFWCVSNMPYNDKDEKTYLNQYLGLSKGNGLNIIVNNEIVDPNHKLYCTKNGQAIGEDFDPNKNYDGLGECSNITSTTISLSSDIKPVISRYGKISLNEIIKKDKGKDKLICSKYSSCFDYFEKKNEINVTKEDADIIDSIIPLMVKKYASVCEKILYKVGSTLNYYNLKTNSLTKEITYMIDIDESNKYCNIINIKTETISLDDVCIVIYEAKVADNKNYETINENFADVIDPISIDYTSSIIKYDGKIISTINGMEKNTGKLNKEQSLIQCLPPGYTLLPSYGNFSNQNYNLAFAGLERTYGKNFISYYNTTDDKFIHMGSILNEEADYLTNLKLISSKITIKNNEYDCYYGNDLTTYVFENYAILMSKDNEINQEFDINRYKSITEEKLVSEKFITKAAPKQSNNKGLFIIDEDRMNYNYLLPIEVDPLSPVIIPYYNASPKESKYTCELLDENDYIDSTIENSRLAGLPIARSNMIKTDEKYNSIGQVHYIIDPVCENCYIVAKFRYNKIANITFAEKIVRIVSAKGFINHLTHTLNQDLSYKPENDSEENESLSIVTSDKVQYYFYTEKTEIKESEINKYMLNKFISRTDEIATDENFVFMKFYPYLVDDDKIDICTSTISIRTEKMKIFNSEEYTFVVKGVEINGELITSETYKLLPNGCDYVFIKENPLKIHLIQYDGELDSIIITYNDEIVIVNNKDEAIYIGDATENSKFEQIENYTVARDIEIINDSKNTYHELYNGSIAIANKCMHYYLPSIDTTACVAAGILGVYEKKTEGIITNRLKSFSKYNQIRRDIGLCSMWEVYDNTSAPKYIEENNYLYAAIEAENSSSGKGQTLGYILPNGWEIASPDQHAFTAIKYHDLGINYNISPNACFILSDGFPYDKNGEPCVIIENNNRALAIDGTNSEAWYKNTESLFDDRCLSVIDINTENHPSYILIRAYKSITEDMMENKYSPWVHIDNTENTIAFIKGTEDKLLEDKEMIENINQALLENTSLNDDDVKNMANTRANAINDDITYSLLGRYIEIDSVNENNKYYGGRTKIDFNGFFEKNSAVQSLIIYTCAKLPKNIDNMFPEELMYKKTAEKVENNGNTTYIWNDDLDEDWRKRLSVYVDASYQDLMIYGIARPFDPKYKKGAWQCVEVRIPASHYY